jgi:hypothetical protein
LKLTLTEVRKVTVSVLAHWQAVRDSMAARQGNALHTDADAEIFCSVNKATRVCHKGLLGVLRIC